MTPPLTGWMFTDARQQVDCPKCGAKAGEYCRTPKGKKTGGGIPHTERTAALVKQFGTSPWIVSSKEVK